MEIQQSPLFVQYIQKLGWKTETIAPYTLFIKSFPFMGAMAKLQRTITLPSVNTMLPILKKHRVKLLVIEPDSSLSSKSLSGYIKKLQPHVRISAARYLSTKTITIDLSESENTIFKRFTEAKRRAVRRAISLGVSVQESTTIQDLIALKSKTAGLFGDMTVYGIKELWPYFSPKNASILLSKDNLSQITGAVLLLYWDNRAYYWIAGATKSGKRSFAPTLLVWEALKLAKKHHCKTFDFVGVWDERLPKENLAWKGFTKFKEGFGGSSLYYPLSLE